MTAPAEPVELHLSDLTPISTERGDGELLSCTFAGESHLVWESDTGETYLMPAACPHKPAAGPTLTRLGIIGATSLLCLRHHNVYDLATGTCLEAAGAGDPGVLDVRRGVRRGRAFIVERSEQSVEVRA